MPVSPHSEQYAVRSERAAWEKRAAVVAEVAEELDRAFSDLKQVGKANFLGDCVEGQAVYNRLRQAIGSLTVDIRSFANRSTALADQCRATATDFEHADVQSAKRLDG
ncbi:hypothetical protein ACN94_15395 [Gordonia paraffinivorans]|nr:hypothetical protein [Gordonia paraffinivorans]